MSDFFLKKWYFDGVSADGRVLIFYAASLTWKGIKIHYSSYLHLSASGEARSETVYKDTREPAVEGHTIRWENDDLRISGEWVSDILPVRTRLFESEAGTIDWNCLHPASRCRLQWGDEPAVEGYGYVECLEMTVPPWEMGFDELRWGRFAHPESPIVWIDMKGTPDRQWVFDGQNKVELAEISDTMVSMPLLKKKLELRDAVIIENKEKILEVVRALIKWLPGFSLFTPFRFLRARESKWRSSGTLTFSGQVHHTGWVIHELVKME